MHELETETVAMFCAAISPDRARQTAHGAPLHDIWETALYMLIPDPRSGIKQVEEDWLERFYKSD